MQKRHTQQDVSFCCQLRISPLKAAVFSRSASRRDEEFRAYMRGDLGGIVIYEVTEAVIRNTA